MKKYSVGMLCKHFKGKNLKVKNIYKILDIGVDYTYLIANPHVIYTGDKNKLKATNLVIYTNIFQENKVFAREYEDLVSVISTEKQKECGQTLRVEPLTETEINMVMSEEFQSAKRNV